MEIEWQSVKNYDDIQESLVLEILRERFQKLQES